jgi:hypothetical protein
MGHLGSAHANTKVVLRILRIAMCLIPGAAPLSGVTMQQLSMDDLAVKSTAIVQGRVTDSYTATNGPTVYTHYHLAVTDTWKGTAGATVDVALPGGTAGGVRQTYPGIPQLAIGSTYVIYLWTSPSTGITMPTGFSQGVFSVGSDSASRGATSDLMLDSTGHPVQDAAVSMRLADMKRGVATALAKSGGVR